MNIQGLTQGRQEYTRSSTSTFNTGHQTKDRTHFKYLRSLSPSHLSSVVSSSLPYLPISHLWLSDVLRENRTNLRAAERKMVQIKNIHQTWISVGLCFHLSLLKSTLPNHHISTARSTALQTHVISSLLTGIFPTTFKQARVTPLLKKTYIKPFSYRKLQTYLSPSIHSENAPTSYFKSGIIVSFTEQQTGC